VKYIKAILLSLIVMSQAAYATQNDTMISVKSNQCVIQVKGIVCSFCAYGAEKNLAKLTFLDATQFGDGVLVDISTHRITLALDPKKPLDLAGIHKAIKIGGYDPLTVHFNLTGIVTMKDKQYILKSKDSGQLFELTGKGLERLSKKGVITVQAHMDAKKMPKLKKNRPIKVIVDKIEEKK